MVAPLSGARYSSGAIFRTKLVSSSSSHGGATERCQVFKWRHLPDQNWLSSSSHGGATERCQVFKWRHLPDKTGYHHHHMVAPLSGARSSSGAIFRTKTGHHHHHMVAPLSGASIQVAPSSGQNWLSSSSHGGATERCQVFKWRHLPDKTGYHHHHMVAPLSGARSSSGAIFRTKTGHHHHHHMVAPLSGARYSSGAIFRTKLVIIIITWWRH